MTTPQNIGRYQVKSEIGRGGMATIFLAFDPRFKRDVAVKVLPRQFTHDPMFRGRFEREAQTIAGLEHYAIVPVYDFGEEDEQPYLVMRYMPGGSLADLISKGSLPLSEIAKIIDRIGAALDEAHDKGIVHRDLKPGNILFDNHGSAFLSDFGIVKLVESAATYTGDNIIGTPAYMSPEQAHGEKVIDRRSDIYALGAMLFEMLTGQIPYPGSTPAKMMMAHLLDPVPNVRVVKEDLPPGCGTLIGKAMAKEQDARFQTAGELATAVNIVARSGRLHKYDLAEAVVKTEVLEPDQLPYVLPSQATEEKRPLRKMPVWGWIGAAVLLIGLVFGAFFIFQNGGDAEPTVTPTLPVAVAAIETATPTITPTDEPTDTPMPTDTPEPTNTPVPTETTVPTSTPTEIACTVPQLRVTGSSVNVRSGPGTNYSSIAVSRADDLVTTIARTNNENWYNVELTDGTVGWIAASVTERIEACVGVEIPVAATIPAPPPNTPTPIPPTNTAVPPPQDDNGNDNDPQPTQPAPTSTLASPNP